MERAVLIGYDWLQLKTITDLYNIKLTKPILKRLQYMEKLEIESEAKSNNGSN